MADREVNSITALEVICSGGRGSLFRAPTNTVGSLLVGNGTNQASFPVGSDGRFLSADSGGTNGLNWSLSSGIPTTTVGTTNGLFATVAAAFTAGFRAFKIVDDVTETNLPANPDDDALYFFIGRGTNTNGAEITYTITALDYTSVGSVTFESYGTVNRGADTNTEGILNITVDPAATGTYGFGGDTREISFRNIHVQIESAATSTILFGPSTITRHTLINCLFNFVNAFPDPTNCVIGQIYNIFITNSCFDVPRLDAGLTYIMEVFGPGLINGFCYFTRTTNIPSIRFDSADYELIITNMLVSNDTGGSTTVECGRCTINGLQNIQGNLLLGGITFTNAHNYSNININTLTLTGVGTPGKVNITNMEVSSTATIGANQNNSFTNCTFDAVTITGATGMKFCNCRFTGILTYAGTNSNHQFANCLLESTIALPVNPASTANITHTGCLFTASAVITCGRYWNFSACQIGVSGGATATITTSAAGTFQPLVVGCYTEIALGTVNANSTGNSLF